MARSRAIETTDTRSALVATASRLFASAGYEATSVQAIIDAAGVAKGTFYHHFASKEAILDAATESLTLQAVEELRPIAEDPTGGAVKKLAEFLLAVRRFRLAHMPLIRETVWLQLSDENAIVVRKMQRRTMCLVAPLLARIIAQGVREGVFDTPDSDEAAELILHVTNFAGEKNARALLDRGDADLGMDEVTGRIRFVVDAAERIIGAPRGSLQVYGREALEVVIRAFRDTSSHAP